MGAEAEHTVFVDLPDVEGMTEHEVRDGFARSLEHYGTVESHVAAQSVRAGEQLSMHRDCYEDTDLPAMFGEPDEQ